MSAIAAAARRAETEGLGAKPGRAALRRQRIAQNPALTCSDCGKGINGRNKFGRCKPCNLKANARFCSICEKQLAPRFKPDATGLCGVCINKERSKDPAYCAARVEGIRAKFRDPQHRAKMARTILANAARARQNPEYRRRLVEHGRWLATTFLHQPEAIAKSKAGRAKAGRSMSETRLAWCPPHYRDEYRLLMRRKRMLAADAKRIILAKLSPFERQMHALMNGARLIEKPILRKAEPSFTLGGVTNWGA